MKKAKKRTKKQQPTPPTSKPEAPVIVKKAALGKAGQAWVDYHMKRMRFYMVTLGMIKAEIEVPTQGENGQAAIGMCRLRSRRL